MTINNVNLKYLEHDYLPRIAKQYTTESRGRDPVMNAANAAIISGISATVTNIFQFVIPHGMPKIATGTPSFGFLVQNPMLGAFSIALGVFALGRFKQSISLAKEFYEEDAKVLTSSEQWGDSLQENLKEDILAVNKLQINIDANNLEFIKDTRMCFLLAIGLIAANAVFSSLSLELLAMATVSAMICTLIFFAYNLGSHWDDNIINKRKIDSLHVNDIMIQLHKINFPSDSIRKPDSKKITFDFSRENMTIPVSPMQSDSSSPLYKVIVQN